MGTSSERPFRLTEGTHISVEGGRFTKTWPCVWK